MLQLGMILTRVHRVLEFKQYPILKSYIDFNTAQRAKATNDFEKDLYKLANNAIYGKTNENVENHISVKFAQNDKRALYYAGLPRTTGFRIFSNNLTAYKMLQSRVTYNRPVMVGAAILDISKTLVFDFHYNYVLPKYGKNARLLFTDTDSLCYHITTADIYEDMRSSSALFDMAGYEPRFQTLTDNAVFNKENKKVIGKMKDEQAEPCSKQDCERCRGSTPLPHAIRAFCGLRAKMYACELIEHSSKMAAKGVKKSHVKSHIKFDNYSRALFGSTAADLRQSATFSAIRSFDHQVATVELTKTSLCAVDTKRYVLPDNIRTLAHGHYAIAETEVEDSPMH